MHTEARMAAAGGGGGFAVEKYSARPPPQRKQQQGVQQHQPQIGTLPHLLAGGVAGAFSKTCTAPLARLTILFQVQGMHCDVATLRKPSIWHEASRIVYEEGFRAFWKGNLVTIAHRLPYSSISFYSYERYKNLLQSIPGLDKNKDYVSADICVRVLGGGLAGITAASITYPLDLVRTRLAAQTNYMYYRGISHALHAICRDEGVRGLYKGLGATLLGVGPNIAISYSAYETLRSHWQLHRPYDSPVLVSLACGSLSGIASSTGGVALSHGTDLIVVWEGAVVCKGNVLSCCCCIWVSKILGDGTLSPAVSMCAAIGCLSAAVCTGFCSGTGCAVGVAVCDAAVVIVCGGNVLAWCCWI